MMTLTRNRAALIGAAALNIPALYWATQLSTGMVLLAAVVLAVVGAMLGTLAAFGVSRTPAEATPLPNRTSRELDRSAA
jgi:membrane protein implicated in regulation of membrane protease activity